MKLRYVNILTILLILGTTAVFGKSAKKSKKRPHKSPQEIHVKTPIAPSEAVQEFYVETSIPSHKGPMQDAGEKPTGYQHYHTPRDGLKIAAQYLPKDPVIVEAGAYDGSDSCFLAACWPKGHIHSFEPVRSLFTVAKSRTRAISNISLYPLALGGHVGDKILYLSHEKNDAGKVSMSSSLYPPHEHLIYADTVFKNCEVVPISTLDAWAIEYGIPTVDMLCLDIQGAELEVLKASPQVLSGVTVIAIEMEFVEAYEKQPLYQEVRAWLEEQGFALVAGTFEFPKKPEVWFADGLFVRQKLVKPTL